MERSSELKSLFFFVAILFTSFVSPATSWAICSEDEFTAIFVVDNIYPAGDPQLRLLDVVQLGPETYPTIPEMSEAVVNAQPSWITWTDYDLFGQEGPFILFFHEPIDEGASAIVDSRDGRVVFFGTMIWLGFGDIFHPEESSHSWSFPAGAPAGEPASIGILPSVYWQDLYGTPTEITDMVVDYLRSSDVLRSFSNCGAYEIVSFIYTPIANPGVDPHTTSLIVIASGQCGPPWSDSISATPLSSKNRLLTTVSPNPFNPVTILSLDIPRDSHVHLAIYTIDGKLVSVLTDRHLASGKYKIPWSGVDRLGLNVSSGTYLARISSSGYSETALITLLK